MEVANLPAHLPFSSISDESADKLADLVTAGKHPRDIARQLHPNDRIKRQRARRRMEGLMMANPKLQERIMTKLRLTMMVGLGPALDGLNRRSERGNVPATKLLLEASGFHNPRVQHEHSGEITVKLDMPRPNFAEASGEVVDAEVVEEGS